MKPCFSPDASLKPRDYLPGIDGLRAIAVLSVLIYHLHPASLPGGFVGVDVFFVISGFVVTRTMVQDPSPLGKFLTSFYARRFVRILPALLVCLAATVAANILLIPNAWLSDALGTTGLAAFLGLSNFALIATSDGYFAPRVDFNPFMHTWSLAVEEQFYAVFPLLLFWGVFRGGIKRQQRYAAIVAALCLASLGWAAYASAKAPMEAYYMLPARFWELGTGAVISLLGSDVRTAIVSRFGRARFMKWGLALIAVAVVATDPNHFPFPWAIPAVAGTSLLLLACGSETPKCLVDDFLTTRHALAVGVISYSLYLWHWPVYAMMRWTVGLNSAPTYVAALCMTFALSGLSYRFVELPAKRMKALWRPSNGLVISAGLAAVGLSFALAWFAYQHSGALKLTTVARNSQAWYPTGPGTLAGKKTACSAVRWLRSSDSVVDFVPDQCEASPPGHGHKLFVLGDSHASAYDRLFDSLVRLTGIEIRRYTSAGCDVPGINRPTREYRPECQELLARFVEDVSASGKSGDAVFLPGMRVPRLSEQYADMAPAPKLDLSSNRGQRRVAERELLDLLPQFTEKGIKVVLELPLPVFASPPYRCADRFNRMNPVCDGGFSVDRAFMEKYRSETVATIKSIASRAENVSVWDPLRVLCSPVACNAFDGDKPLFFDGDHLSGYGNELLVPSFLRHISVALGMPEVLIDGAELPFAAAQEPSYGATLADGIDFRKNGYPDFVAAVQGVSTREDWGRWSDANLGDVAITFKKPLPKSFRLILEARAIGPNEGKNIELRIGSFRKDIKLGYQPETLSFDVQNMSGADTVDLIPPQPTLGTAINPQSNDLRLLGVGLVSMKIISEGR